MNELALFAGAGGGILGGKLLGWRTVCAVERDAYAAQVLAARQNDGSLPAFPIWSDVRSFDGRPWRGIVDVVSGGFPCQDISKAGNGAGIVLGSRSGLWVEMARIIREVRPQYAFLENSPAITSRGMDIVLGDLAEMGFDAQWGVFSACAQGAPHTRERMFVVANSRCDRSQAGKRIEGTPPGEWSRGGRSPEQGPIRGNSGRHPWMDTEPDVDRVADGMANKLDRVKSIGNGQVPLVAAAAWRILTTTANVTGLGSQGSADGWSESDMDKRRCDECGHTGTDGGSTSESYCGACGKTVPYPDWDLCPECGTTNRMLIACPECGGRYSLDEEHGRIS